MKYYPTLNQIREAHAWKRDYEKYLPLSRYFYRPIGFILTWIAIRLGLTTEATSWLSGLAGIIGLLCLLGKSIEVVWVGIGLLIFFNLLDCVDGSIARVMQSENPYGKFLDSVLGDVIDFGFFVAVGIMAYRSFNLLTKIAPPSSGSSFWAIVGGITAFLYIFLTHIEHLFDYQIRKPASTGHGNRSITAPHSSFASYDMIETDAQSTWRTACRLIDRNFRVRETHLLFLIVALLLKVVDLFLLFYFAYYLLRTTITSIVYFRRAKQLRNRRLRSQ